MAVPVLASSASGHDTSNQTSRTVTYPSGVVSGNWIILCATIDAAATITTPTGYTLEFSLSTLSGSTEATTYIFSRKADGTEGASFSLASSNEEVTWIIERITGADSTAAIDVLSYGMGEINNQDKPRFGECWAAYTDNLLLAFGTLDAASGTLTDPSGFTSVVAEGAGASGNVLAGWKKDQSAQGYTGFVSSTTTSTTVQYCAILVVIKSQTGTITYPSEPVRRVTNYHHCNSTNVMTYNKPYGTASGDLLLMWQEADTNVLIPDAAFTSVQNVTNGNCRGQLYKRTAGGSESATYAGASSTTGAKLGCLMRLANIDATTPVNVSANATGTSVSPSSPDITTTAANCLALAFYCSEDDLASQDSAYPTGYTGVFNSNTQEASDSSMGLAYKIYAATGATGAAAWTSALSGSTAWVGIHVAIAPVAVTGSVASSTGTSTAQATAASSVAAVGSSTGAATAQATAKSSVAAVGSSTGASTVQATGATAVQAVASSAGSSTAQATAASTVKAVGSSAGVGAASGIAASTVNAVGSAAGTSTVTGLSTELAQSAGSSAGSSTAQATSNTLASSIGSAAGTSTVDGIASGSIISQAVGNATGTSDAQAISSTLASSVGASDGTSTAQAVGTSTVISLTQPMTGGSIPIRKTKKKESKAPTIRKITLKEPEIEVQPNNMLIILLAAA